MNELRDREQTKQLLADLYEKGYRYIVRDKGMQYLGCYSHKPKKYMDMECWGYPDRALRDDDTKPAMPIKNKDITEINWTNRSAVLISDFLKSE